MNHEKRLTQIEKQMQEIKDLLEASGLMSDFVKLSQASRELNINPWVIRDRIKNDRNIILGKHYQMNGTHYLVNVKQWRKLIASDVAAKRS